MVHPPFKQNNRECVMKKMLLLLCGAVAVIAGVTGCSTTYREAGADYLSRPKDAGSIPYYTEFSVSPRRVESKGNATVILGFFQISEGKQCLIGSDPNLSVWSKIMEYFSPTQMAINNAKGAAVYNACERHNADQVLGASFEYKISNYLIFASVECTVKGFPATVTSVKVLAPKPIVLNEWQRVEMVPDGVNVKDSSGGAPQIQYQPKSQRVF